MITPIRIAVAVVLITLGTSRAAEGEYTATIVRVGDTFGNLETDLDAARLGLSPGSGFTLICKDQTIGATWGTWYTDVPEGEWLGLTNEDGNVQIAINGGNADTGSGCTTGDVLTIRTVGSP